MKRLYYLSTWCLSTLLFTLSAFSVNAQTLEADSLALVDLYNDCGGADWSGFDTWLNGPISTWEKVTVDEAMQRVTNVEFKEMHLTGALPESLGNITEMSGKIEFRDDSLLTGALPSFLWKWTKIDRFQIKFSGYTSIETDGLENMVNLTEFNTEGSPIGGMIPGVIFTLPNIEKLYFHDSEFDQLPAEVTQATALTRLYLNGDNFSELPDMSGMTWGSGAKVRFQDNQLTFEDLEPLVGFISDANVDEFRYSPQANVGQENYQYPAVGAPVSLAANVGGANNVYQWIKDGEEEVGTDATYEIAAFDASVHSGKYFGVVQNTTVPGLVIMTEPTHLFASALSQDSLALVDLYNDCGGADWSGFGTWLNGPINTWEKVTVDEATQRVTNVEFKEMHLTGALPESLGNITKMGGKIEFRDDSLLTGALPAFLWRWTDVERFQIKFSGYTSIETEGLENMINLTEFNTEGSPIAGEIPGVIFTLPAIEKLYFHDSEFDQLPAEVTQATALTRLYLNGDNFSELPDMSGMTWGSGAKVRFHDNQLTFEDLEPLVGFLSDANVDEFRYSPQANVGEETYQYPAIGDPVTLAANVGGADNIYQWIKGTDEEVGTDATYEIAAFDPSVHSGKYLGIVQNTTVPGLVITVEPTHLFASAFSQDSLALVDLYNNCGGADWSGFATWLNGPLNTWERVTVDSATQRVTNVEFKDMHLTGALPETLGNITKMSGKIELRDDSLLTGALPAFLWRWTDIDRFQVKFSGYTSIETEGLENMVNLTEFNTEGSPIAGTIPGEIFALPLIEKLYFHDSEFDALPAEFLQVSGLTRLYLNGDNFASLPDMTQVTWGDGAKIRLQNNFLTFEDLEGNVAVDSDPLVDEFSYSPQANVGMPVTIELMAGDTLRLSIDVGGTANSYQWIIGEEDLIDGATEAMYQKDDVTAADAVKYRALIQNSLVPGLDLFSEFFSVTVDGVSGIQEQEFEGLKVLGNPVGHLLRIEANENIERLSLFDMTGRLLEERSINSQSLSLPVDHLQAGVYFAVLRSGNKFHTIKVLKK